MARIDQTAKTVLFTFTDSRENPLLALLREAVEFLEEHPEAAIEHDLTGASLELAGGILDLTLPKKAKPQS